MKTNLVILMVLTCLAGCNKQSMVADRSVRPFEAKIMQEMSPPVLATPLSVHSPDTVARYRVIRQHLTIEVPTSQLKATWQAALDACTQAPPDQCDILVSSLSQNATGAPGYAELQIRIAPAQQGEYRKKLLSQGTLIDDRTQSEDKTAEVIDTDAQLKNTTVLRDRLRSMQGKTGMNVKDLVELERELARAQAEVDSLTGRRKALANETDKIFMGINFHAQRNPTEAGTIRPITDAFLSSGRILSESIGSLISFLVAALPWLALLSIATVIVRKIWQRLRRQRGENAPQK